MTNINLQVVTVKDVLLSGLTKRVEEIGMEWEEIVYTLPIVEGVSVDIFAESGQAVLRIGEQQNFEFFFNDEMAKLLSEWDTCKPLEIFDALYRNRYELKADPAYNDYSTLGELAG